MGLEKINEIRKAQKLSVDELCQLSGVAKGTLAKITAGITKRPRIQTVQAIARALNVSVDVFADEIDDNAYTPKEIELVSNYRRLDTHGKSLIDTVMMHELESMEEGDCDQV